MPGPALEAATKGRVEILYVGQVVDTDHDLIDRAIVETLRNSGQVLASPDESQGVTATLRF